MPFSKSIHPTDSNRRPFARQSQISDENSSEGTGNRIHRNSTQISEIPDRPSIDSFNTNEPSVPDRTSSVKSDREQKVRISNRPATINIIGNKKV